CRARAGARTDASSAGGERDDGEGRALARGESDDAPDGAVAVGDHLDRVDAGLESVEGERRAAALDAVDPDERLRRRVDGENGARWGGVGVRWSRHRAERHGDPEA